MKNVSLQEWSYVGDKVRLAYADGVEFFVSKKDFDRAFGCIVSAPRNDVIRDFALDKGRTVYASMKKKLSDPVQYQEVIQRMMKFLKVTTEEEAIATGFKLENEVKHDEEHVCNRYRHYFDVGNGFAGNLMLITEPEDNNTVSHMLFDIPLCYCDNSNHIPEDMLMKHMVSLTEAFAQVFECTAFVGPIFVSDDDPIDWRADMDLNEIIQKYVVKSEELSLPSIKEKSGELSFVCLDPAGGLWKIVQILHLAPPYPDDPYSADRGMLGLCIEKIIRTRDE